MRPATAWKELTHLQRGGFLRSNYVNNKKIYTLTSEGERVADRYHMVNSSRFETCPFTQNGARLINVGEGDVEIDIKNIKVQLGFCESMTYPSFISPTNFSARNVTGNPVLIVERTD